MESQTTTTEFDPKFEEVALNLENKKNKNDEGDKTKKGKTKKGKGKKAEPTDEEIMAAIAGVVLREMSFWPESVVRLIGDKHPTKESFLLGVPYIIGCYMHLALESLKKEFKRRRKEVELRAVKLLGPLTIRREEIAQIYRRAQEQVIRDLSKERKKEIEKAKKEINARYEKMISKVRASDPPDDVILLAKEEAKVKEAYDGAKAKLDAEMSSIREAIEEIDVSKGSWNDKDRRDRRLNSED